MLRSNRSILLVVAVISVVSYQRVAQLRFAGTVADAMHQIDTYFVNPVDRRQLFESSLRGMVKELDPYSGYIGPDEYRQLQEEIEQVFGGIGVAVELHPNLLRPYVINVRPGGPADKAGVLAGDVILKIEDVDTQSIDASDPVKLIRGKPGTTIRLTLQSMEGEEPREVFLVRAPISVDSVMGFDRDPQGHWRFFIPHQPQIGYLWIDSFGENTAQELASALQQIPDAEAVIIDLRANPGGLLQSAVRVCDMFVSDGDIVAVRGRYGEKEYSARPQNEVLGREIPLVVLVDRHSASASEIFAACLQDDGRAVVMGERTWGKGTVQSVIELEGGRSALRLTTATYWRRSGQNIHRHVGDDEHAAWGVTPDPGFEIKLSDEQYLGMIRARRQRFVGPSPSITQPPSDTEHRNAVEKDTRDVDDAERATTDPRALAGDAEWDTASDQQGHTGSESRSDSPTFDATNGVSSDDASDVNGLTGVIGDDPHMAAAIQYLLGRLRPPDDNSHDDSHNDPSLKSPTTEVGV